jgi:hypothetical protein
MLLRQGGMTSWAIVPGRLSSQKDGREGLPPQWALV